MRTYFDGTWQEVGGSIIDPRNGCWHGMKKTRVEMMMGNEKYPTSREAKRSRVILRIIGTLEAGWKIEIYNFINYFQISHVD